MKRLADIDARMFQWIAARTESTEHSIAKSFKWVSKSADGHLYLPIALLLYFADTQHGALFFYTALLAYCFEIPLYLVLKHLFKRQRPCDLLEHLKAHVVPADKFSLPSGHTAAAFLMASMIAHFYPSLSVLVYVWASLVGMSRVVLRVHFPLDVFIGACLGTGVSFMSIFVLAM